MRSGQEGFTEAYDPRFGLTWLSTGPVVPSRPSYITGCSFHDSYSTGIGIFDAEGINVKDNIVHRPIHDGKLYYLYRSEKIFTLLLFLGIRIAGNNIALERNLVVNSLFRGSYRERFEENNFLVSF